MKCSLCKYLCKVEKILKGSLDSIPSPSMKIQTMGGNVCLRCKGKTLLGVVNKFLKTKSLLTSPSNVCLSTSSKLSRQEFEFSLKVMGLNPGYLFKSFLLYKFGLKHWTTVSLTIFLYVNSKA